MKKLGLVFVVLFLLSSFYACEKDQLGIYNPKMKIDKIYNEKDGRYLLEQWQWNDKLLSKIDFYRSNESLKATHTYLYDENRLTRVQMEGSYSDFIYDGKELRTINTYTGSQLLETYQLSFKKDKLSHISIKRSAKGGTDSDLMSFFIPGSDHLSLSRPSSSESKGENYDYSAAEMDFVWDGDNVQYLKMSITRPDSIQHLTFSYVYDDNMNPKHGFLSLYPIQSILNGEPQYQLCSKNNIVSVMVTDEYDIFSKTESFTYSYEYYKNYPTKVYHTFLNKETWMQDSTLIYSYIYLY